MFIGKSFKGLGFYINFLAKGTFGLLLAKVPSFRG